MEKRKNPGKCRTSIYRRNMRKLKLLQQVLPYDARLRSIPSNFFEKQTSTSRNQEVRQLHYIQEEINRREENGFTMKQKDNFLNGTSGDTGHINYYDNRNVDMDGGVGDVHVEIPNNDDDGYAEIDDNADADDDDDSEDADTDSIADDAADTDSDTDADEDDTDIDTDGDADEDDTDTDTIADDDDNDYSFFDVNNLVTANLPLISKKHIQVKDHLLAITAIAVKNRTTYETALDMCEWNNNERICRLLPVDKASLWKAMGRQTSRIVSHFYCRKCTDYLGPKNKKTNQIERQCYCKKCGPQQEETHLGYFLYIGLTSQIKQLFKIPNIVESLKYRFLRNKLNPNAIEDIYDGQQYQELCKSGKFLERWHNCSLTFNTDGYSVSKSSGTSAWPLYAEINELPPHMRKKHMLLAGIYVDDQHPSMGNFLRPLVTEMRKLFKEGITWKPTETMEITSKFIITTCTLDSPAKAAVTRTTQWNGKFGCLYCFARGKSIKRGTFVYPLEHSFGPLRTDSQIWADMAYVLKNGGRKNGIRGVSPLTVLPLFSMSKGVVVEAMHAVFLGAAKHHTSILLKTTKTPFYIGHPNKLKVIDHYLLSIRPPSRRSRRPKSITTYKKWKASEWRNWLDYAPVCLKNVLSSKYLDHLVLLSEAIHYLNSDSITPEQLDRAEDLLNRYVTIFPTLFGTARMTSNIHSLTHLIATVRNWGPLWAHNAFTFESWNEKIMDRITSPHGRQDQVATRFLMLQYLNHSVFDQSVSQETKRFLRKKLNIIDETSKTGLKDKFIGQGKSYTRLLTELERDALARAGYEPASVTTFKKMLFNGIKFSCESTEKSKSLSFCNSFIYNDKNKTFGSINSIVRFSCNNLSISGIIIRNFQDIKGGLNSHHIREIAPLATLTFIEETTPIRSVIKMFSDEILFGVRLSNCLETD